MSMTINAAGGGSGLNFSIVCDVTQPTPKENMIWVNTGKPLNGFVFASSAPAAPLEGMVWILTSNGSTVAFNAAKKGVLMVYPIMCRQYISGAWTDVTAKSYIGNGWRDWIIYLYSPGNPHAELTGGWEGKAHRRVDTVDGYSVNSVAPTITQGAESMTVTLSAPTYYNYSGSARTVNKIDLTDFSRIIFDFTFSGGTISFYVTQSDTSYSAVKQLAVTGSSSNAASLDVSDLTGEFYVGINLLAGSGTQTVTVTQITVE
jgi:hypothetical protein